MRLPIIPLAVTSRDAAGDMVAHIAYLWFCRRHHSLLPVQIEVIIVEAVAVVVGLLLHGPNELVRARVTIDLGVKEVAHHKVRL